VIEAENGRKRTGCPAFAGHDDDANAIKTRPLNSNTRLLSGLSSEESRNVDLESLAALAHHLVAAGFMKPEAVGSGTPLGVFEALAGGA